MAQVKTTVRVSPISFFSCVPRVCVFCRACLCVCVCVFFLVFLCEVLVFSCLCACVWFSLVCVCGFLLVCVCGGFSLVYVCGEEEGGGLSFQFHPHPIGQRVGAGSRGFRNCVQCWMRREIQEIFHRWSPTFMLATLYVMPVPGHWFRLFPSAFAKHLIRV